MVHRDPDVDQLRKTFTPFLAELRKKPFSEQRATFDASMAGAPLPEDCKVQRLDLFGIAAEKISHPSAIAGKTLLFFHGGGYVMGSLTTGRDLVARLSIAARVTGYHIDYRLAPEHPYPAALEDALTVYVQMLAFGIAPENLVVGGESAGGNLAAALLLKLRDSQLPQPAGLYLLSPWLDMTTTGESYDTVGDRDPVTSRQEMEVYAATFLGGKPDDAYTSPVRADLTGLPPVMIQVGTEEVLLSDSLTFANRAALAGLSVRLHVWSGMPHVWPFLHAIVRAGLPAIDEAGQWIRERVASN
jgi:acetyl esterase/lipase